MQAFVGTFTKLRWGRHLYGDVTAMVDTAHLRTFTTMPNPLEIPSHLQNYYSPDFKHLYKQYLGGRTDNRFLPLAEVRGRTTYGSLPVRSEIQWAERYVSRSEAPPLHLRVYYPQHASGERKKPLGIILYFPGGGFVFNTPASEHGLASHLCALSSCIVATVGYRLSPENPFPAPVIDARDALAAIQTQSLNQGCERWAREYVQPKLPIGVVGSSAGAGLAAYLALTERAVKAAMLWVPIVTWDFGSMDAGPKSSWQRFQQSPFLSSDKMEWFRTMYIKEKDWSKPMASPLTVLKEATTRPLVNLPDFRVAVAGGDVLKDQGVQFAELANTAGEISKRYNDGSVDRVVLKVYEGTSHSLISAAGENEIGRREVVEGSKWIAEKLSRIS